jgi:excisionase family DNA binding protein
VSLPQVLTVAEAAKWLKVPEGVIEEEIRVGRLKPFKIGGEWRITENALRQLIQEPADDEAAPASTLTLTSAAPFKYRWPQGIERFVNAQEGKLEVEGNEVSVRIGECVRDVYGRPRKRIVVFFDGYPNCEFIETDEPPGYYYSILPGSPNPRKHLRPGDRVDEWQSFTIRELRQVVRGPRSGESLVVILPGNDFESMVRFTRLKAHKRWGW